MNAKLVAVAIVCALCMHVHGYDRDEKAPNVACDVVIVGGTTAAFAAAIASAAEGVETCLIEPTDWVGGQLTASAVVTPSLQFLFDSFSVQPAIDFAWHTVWSLLM